MRLGVVFVHYHTPELARRAVASVERELAALAGEGVRGRVVIVDNGSDAAGSEVLAGLAAEVLRPPGNLGYAGGVNAGAARLPESDVLLLANPDLELLPGALAALLATLGRGAAVAGPRFFWDFARRLRLPPTEARDPWSEALAALAGRSPRWARRARRRWRRHARRHWLAESDIASTALSGALLAVSRGAWDRVGPFDAAFPLYFEETDWLTRLERAGLPARYVPAAEVVHSFARSAAMEPQSADWFRESAARYAAKHQGRLRRAAMTALGGAAAPAERPEAAEATVDGAAAPPPRAPGQDDDLDLFSLADGRRVWVEVSPRREGFPAAAEPLAPGARAWSLPAEVRGGLAGTWWARVTDDAGRDLLRRRPLLGGSR